MKKTSPGTEILVFPVQNKILKIWDKIFELINIEAQYIGKETQKSYPKLKNVYIIYLLYIFILYICAACDPMQVVVFFVNMY